MTAATTTRTPESDQAQEDHIPVRLWLSYKRARARNEKPRHAAKLALEGSGFTSQRGRERLVDLLVGREQQRGLGSTEAERDEELALEAAEVEAGGPVVAAEPEEGSVEAIRRDAERTVAELEAAERRLAPEGIGADADPDVLAELGLIEGQLKQARVTLSRTGNAEREIARREREAAEQAERAGHDQAEAQFRELQPEIHGIAVEFDAAASVLAEILARYQDKKGTQAAAVAGTTRGEEAVRRRSYRPADPAAALYVALRERGVTIAGIDGSNRAQPLAAIEPEVL